MCAEKERRHLIVGTAGHIDHGKTSLIKAMTGVDADTLEEEKQRGITIELGFVFMETPDPDCEVLFIDVPGHEKLVKTMVAGASNLDAALLVIAADDGINLQTREHFDILRFLDIPKGLIALTKCDLLEEPHLTARKASIRQLVEGSFLEGAPIIPVSSVTGEGVDTVKSALYQVAGSIRKREDTGIFRMPVDRVFTMRGFGTVVAGTILSGELNLQDTVEVYPEGMRSKVRGIQVHGKKTSTSSIGKRTAVNLQSIPKEKLRRGQCIGFPGTLTPTNRIDAQFRLLHATKEVKNLSRLRFYTGTSEVLCRVALLDRNKVLPGETAPAQFILEKEVVALPQDRFVIRTLSPLYTVGGGTILDINPVKHKRFDEAVIDGLSKLDGGLDELLVYTVEKAGLTAIEQDLLIKEAGQREDEAKAALTRLIADNEIFRHQDGNTIRFLYRVHYETLANRLLQLARQHLSATPGTVDAPFNELQSEMLKTTDRPTFRFVLSHLIETQVLERRGTTVMVCGYDIPLSEREQQYAEKIETVLIEAGFASPLEKKIGEMLGLNESALKKIIASLILRKRVYRLSDKVTYHRQTLDKVTDFVLNFVKKEGSISISELRDELKVSRKYTQAVLEYLNETGMTRREGDRHVMS